MKPLRDKSGKIAAVPAAERFQRLVDTSAGPLGCWPFLGATLNGYGSFRDGPKKVKAHRFAWKQATGADPLGQIDHTCHDPDECEGGDTCPHRRCCNPGHLRDTTSAENNATGRRRTKAYRTECANGHPWDDANTYTWQGSRRCRVCDASGQRRRRLTAADQ